MSFRPHKQTSAELSPDYRGGRRRLPKGYRLSALLLVLKDEIIGSFDPRSNFLLKGR
jgi:hypothetical protein